MRTGRAHIKVLAALFMILGMLVAAPGNAGAPWTYSARGASSNCHANAHFDGEGGAVIGVSYLHCSVDVGPGELEVGNLFEARLYVRDFSQDTDFEAKLCVASLTEGTYSCGPVASSVGSSGADQIVVVRPPVIERTSDTMAVTLVVHTAAGSYPPRDYSKFYGYTVKSL